MGVRFRAGEDGEKLLLQAPGHRAAPALPDHNAINRAQRCNLGSGAGEENFVGNVEHFTRDHLFADWDAQIFAQGENRVARDAWKDARGQRRCRDDAILHQKDIFARAFAHVAGGVERDALGVAIGMASMRISCEFM